MIIYLENQVLVFLRVAVLPSCFSVCANATNKHPWWHTQQRYGSIFESKPSLTSFNVCDRCRCRGREGFQTHTPLKNHKVIGILSNSGRVLWKLTKLPSQYSMLGHHRRPSEMTFAGDTIIIHFLWYLDPLSSYQLKMEKEKKRKVMLSELDTLWQSFLDPRMCKQQSCLWFCAYRLPWVFRCSSMRQISNDHELTQIICFKTFSMNLHLKYSKGMWTLNKYI